MIIPSIQNENNLHIRKEDRVRETILTEKFKIGGKSLKKIKQLFSFVLICATVLGTLSVYAQEPKDPPSVEAVSYTHLKQSGCLFLIGMCAYRDALSLHNILDKCIVV